MTAPKLDPDRLLPTGEGVRRLARTLYEEIATLPLICPHGHTDPAWFVDNACFEDAAELLILPDHYVLRMLLSQGVCYDDLGVPRADGTVPAVDGRSIWRLFAANYRLFLGTPSRVWMDHALYEVIGVDRRLDEATADYTYDFINERLADDSFRPRALYERFGIEVLATTDDALDDLANHRALRDGDWQGRVIPTFRPDRVTDPDNEGFRGDVPRLAELTGEDVTDWSGYLAALRRRRATFIGLGATATDSGFPTARTADLAETECQRLLTGALAGTLPPDDADLFRGQMLTEMARMSIDDGLVMQLHVGSGRNYAPAVQARYGRDRGFDIPMATDWSKGLKPLLDACGLDERLRLILFTLDEATYTRELAPLVGAFPSLLLGPPWWFFDSPNGMRDYRRRVTETAGYFNTAGFNDDTRALLSIPARHDMYRRVEAGVLAEFVAEGQFGLEEARDLAQELAVGLVRRAYKL